MNQIDEENTVFGYLVSIPAVLDNGAAVALKEEDISFTQDELDVPKEQPLFRKNPNALKKNVRFDTQTYSTPSNACKKTAIEVLNDSINNWIWVTQRRSKSDWSLSTGSPHESEFLLQSLKSQEPPAESQYFDALDAIDEEENSVRPEQYTLRC